jgi:hypothetical protein
MKADNSLSTVLMLRLGSPVVERISSLLSRLLTTIMGSITRLRIPSNVRNRLLETRRSWGWSVSWTPASANSDIRFVVSIVPSGRCLRRSHTKRGRGASSGKNTVRMCSSVDDSAKSLNFLHTNLWIGQSAVWQEAEQ